MVHNLLSNYQQSLVLLSVTSTTDTDAVPLCSLGTLLLTRRRTTTTSVFKCTLF